MCSCRLSFVRRLVFRHCVYFVYQLVFKLGIVVAGGVCDAF